MFSFSKSLIVIRYMKCWKAGNSMNECKYLLSDQFSEFLDPIEWYSVVVGRHGMKHLQDWKIV